MSSVEEDNDTTRSQTRKKRRRMRACDMCRRRKVRCDGGQMPNGICTNCLTFKYKCTYVESAPKKRIPDLGYLESLETQMSEMRTLLNKYRQLYPDAELSDDLNRIVAGASPFPEAATATNSPQPSASTAMFPSSASSIVSPLSPASTIDLNDPEPEFDPSDDEISAHKNLAQSFDNMHLYTGHDNFLGKSSSMMFLQAALESKQEYFVGGPPKRPHAESQSGTSGSMSSTDGAKGKAREHAPLKVPILLETKRIEYWQEHSWVIDAMQEHPEFTFPPTDLMLDLVSLYFSEYNIYSPLLHRPTFDGDIQDGLHLRDHRFGAVVLLVCALGARASDDPRVLLDVEQVNAKRKGKLEHEKTYHSAGWIWFEQVQKSKLTLSFLPTVLYDMQVAYLAAIYTWGTHNPQTAWNSVGYGLRLAQSMGAHRKKSYKSTPTVEEELLKRAFWSLLQLDRLHSSVLGRPCGIHDEDFDVDLPIACDDEYWLHPDPEQAFKQPPDKPSRTIYFNYLLRLSQIHAFALRTIYSINKSKALLGLVGHDWQQRIVAEIDSALNRWIDSLPAHLRWDPRMEDTVFLNQSACLYSAYYTVQIVVHRPFIPTPRNPSPLSFPSLAICTNAARSCIHVLDGHWRRTHSTSHMHQYGLFSSGIVLLLNIWGGKKSMTSAEAMKEVEEVYKAMNIVKELEPRWYSAGRIWDILHDLANVGDLPLPQEPTEATHKRPRDEAPEQTSSESYPAPDKRPVAGSKRVQQYQQQQSQLEEPATFGAQPSFPLPLYSQDLGRMPLHPFAEHQVAPPGSDAVHPTGFSYNTALGCHPAPIHMCDSQMLDDNATMRQPIDPAFEALLSMLSPVQYQQPPTVSGAARTMPQVPNDFVQEPSTSINLTANQAVNPAMTIDPANIQQQQPGLSADALDSDTLAMWSSAPSGFGWEDWGTYVTNFNAAGTAHYPPS